jgi:HD-GYP domain-containing protein (c-di-GMP phosphodiesterase class II)
MNKALEVSSLNVDSKEVFYELMKERDDLQIINIHRTSQATLYFFDKEEKKQFLFCIVMNGELDLYYKDKKEQLKRNAYFYYEQLNDLIRVEIRENANLLIVTSMKFFEDINKGFSKFYEMIDSIGEKDHYTKGHCLRVKQLAKKTGEKFGFSNQQLFHITYAAQFHDIGKIKVDDDILKKKGKLTDVEFSEMRKHVAYSAELFRDHFTFLSHDFDPDLITTTIIQHHERLDGSGYPKGLKEDEILLEAKVLAVCDSFDAMVTDRPYKAGKTREVAVNELKELSNRHYDPEVVKVFEDVLEDVFNELY